MLCTGVVLACVCVTCVFSLQSRAMHVRLNPMVKQADALTSVCSAGATNLEVAAAALASVWEMMASPAKVSVLTVCFFSFSLLLQ